MKVRLSLTVEPNLSGIIRPLNAPDISDEFGVSGLTAFSSSSLLSDTALEGRDDMRGDALGQTPTPKSPLSPQEGKGTVLGW